MQRYPVSRERQKELTLPLLQQKITAIFAVTPTQSGGFLTAPFGALKELRVGFEGKNLLVETVTQAGASPEDQARTIKAYNQFLELATGFTAKERAKKAQAAAKKGASA